MAQRSRTLDLPVAVNESISLELDPLPPSEDVQVFLEALSYEEAPSKYWTRLATQLWIEKRLPEAHQICSKGVQVLSPRKAGESVALYGLLSAFGLYNAANAPKQVLPDAKYQNLTRLQNKDVYSRTVAENIGQAQPIDPQHHLTQLLKAIHSTTIGQNDGALALFDAVLKKQPKHAIALLGKACILLRKRQYAPALKLYQQVLEASLLIQADADKHGRHLGWRGPDPRVGLGLCLWGLGHHDAARKAWKRAAQLNQSNAPAHLLLGISSLNAAKQTPRLVPGTFGAHVQRSEQEARQLAYSEGMASLQESWKLEKRNAMAAIAMCDFFINKASQAESGQNESTESQQAAMVHYSTALKLGEHAIQYADSRSAVLSACLVYARASHLASQLSINNDKPELRLQAQRYYTRVVEDTFRTSGASISSSGQLPPGLALATLGLAQCQVANRDPLAAINTLEALTGRPSAATSVTPMIELLLLAASLRSQSHPGATTAERQADSERARIMLDRALRLIEAAKVEVYGQSSQSAGPDEFPSASTAVNTEGDVAGPLAKALFVIRSEELSKTAQEAIASLGNDPLARVELADLLQSEDLTRATAAYSDALELAKTKTTNTSDAMADTALVTSLETCLGAVLAIRASEISDHDGQRQEERNWLLSRAVLRLESAIGGAAAAGAASDAGPIHPETQRALDAVKLIASYNLGRANEALDNGDVARQAYEALLRAHPEYVDAKVRLAILHVTKAPVPGPESAALIKVQRDAANSLFKEALASDPGNLDTRATYVCFLAGEFPGSPQSVWSAIKDFTAQLFAGSTDAASKAVFGSAIAAKAAADEGRRDAHTLASLGWAYYQLAIHAVGAQAKAERGKGMMRATDLMDKALQSDPRCAFAAQGMAILLAEDAFAETAGGTGLTLPSALGGAPEERRKRNADEAIAILSKLREVRDEASVHVCTGHALMQKEEYERALKAYETAAKRFHSNPSASVLQYIARAEYAIGMKNKSFAVLKSSLANLERARALVGAERGGGHPQCRQIEYNMAVTAQKALQMLFDLPKDRKSSQDVRDAVQAVERVQPLLLTPTGEPMDTALGKEGALLEAAKRGHLLYISAEVVEQRGKYGASSLLQRATQALADQERYEGEIQKHKDAVAAARRDKELAREQERIRKQEEYQHQVEQMSEKRKALRQEAAQIEYARELTPEKEPKGRRAKRADVTSGEEDAPDGETVRDKGKKRKRTNATGGKDKKKRTKKGKKDAVAESEDDDESDDDDAGLFGGKGGSSGSGSDSSDNNDDEDGDEEIIRNGADMLASEGDGSSRRGKSLSKLSKDKKKAALKKQKQARPSKTPKKRERSLKRATATADSTDDDDDDDGDGGDEDDDPVTKKSQARTRKANVTNDLIDSDEEMALD